MTTKRYSELLRHRSFEDRFRYLKLDGVVGRSTFGFDRYLNQMFYQSKDWKDVRRHVILRDEGCDLGVHGHEINGAGLVHHLNPISVDDIVHGESWLLDPEFLITTTHDTHNAIHYADATLLKQPYKPRRPGDTNLW